jgi:hypothetical protein
MGRLIPSEEEDAMGEVIRKTAAADDIFSDVRATLVNARAKGGVWATLAEEQLSAVVALMDAVTSRHQEVSVPLPPLLAAIEAKDEEADRLLGRISDEIWNEVGRPASDAALSLLFPGGIAYYADGKQEEQPDRMELLVELLEAGIHPRLPSDKARTYAQAISDAAAALRGAYDAARLPLIQAKQLDQVRRALATTAQVHLAGLKRRYKVERFSEAEIHHVIPDRPRGAKEPVPAERA